MKLMTWNICAVSAAHKLAAINNMLQIRSPDVVLFQEVACPGFQFRGYNEAVNVGEAGRGTAVLWREGLQPQPTNIVKLPSGRAMSVRIGDVTVANVYAPAGSQGRRERPRFFIEDLPLVLADVAEHLILAGDFNAILDKAETTGVATPCPVLRSVVESLRLRDAWKTLQPREQGFTFTSSTCASRLDRWYVTRNLPLLSVNMHAASVSDHAALLLRVQIGNPTSAGGVPTRQAPPPLPTLPTLPTLVTPRWWATQRTPEGWSTRRALPTLLTMLLNAARCGR